MMTMITRITTDGRYDSDVGYRWDKVGPTMVEKAYYSEKIKDTHFQERISFFLLSQKKEDSSDRFSLEEVKLVLVPTA